MFSCHSSLFCPSSHPEGVVARFYLLEGLVLGCDIPRGLPLISRFFPRPTLSPEISPILRPGTLILVNSINTLRLLRRTIFKFRSNHRNFLKESLRWSSLVINILANLFLFGHLLYLKGIGQLLYIDSHRNENNCSKMP